MSETPQGPPEAGADAVEEGAQPCALTIAEIRSRLTALQEAGELTPEGARLLARAEAFEDATRELVAIEVRLKAILREVEEDAIVARKGLH